MGKVSNIQVHRDVVSGKIDHDYYYHYFHYYVYIKKKSVELSLTMRSKSTIVVAIDVIEWKRDNQSPSRIPKSSYENSDLAAQSPCNLSPINESRRIAYL
jgi:hypothetical protein